MYSSSRPEKYKENLENQRKPKKNKKILGTKLKLVLLTETSGLYVNKLLKVKEGNTILLFDFLVVFTVFFHLWKYMGMC